MPSPAELKKAHALLDLIMTTGRLDGMIGRAKTEGLAELRENLKATEKPNCPAAVAESVAKVFEKAYEEGHERGSMEKEIGLTLNDITPDMLKIFARKNPLKENS